MYRKLITLSRGDTWNCKKTIFFLRQYLCTRSTSDVGMFYYINGIYCNGHSPDVWQIPPEISSTWIQYTVELYYDVMDGPIKLCRYKRVSLWSRCIIIIKKTYFKAKYSSEYILLSIIIYFKFKVLLKFERIKITVL